LRFVAGPEDAIIKEARRMLRRFIIIMLRSGAFLLLLSIFSSAGHAKAANIVSREINEDFAEQKKAPDFAKKRVGGKDVRLLENDNECPLDGSAVKHIRLASSRSYSEISREAYLCEKERVYWIKLRQGAYRGERVSWFGPFTLKAHKKPVQGRTSSLGGNLPQSSH
jgi:hypothetical protein